MSHVLAVATLELRRHRRALAIAPLLGLPPVLFAWLGPHRPESTVEARGLAAVVVALLFSGLLALALGWSGLASDQASGRLRFFFARPLAGGAIWGGRLLAFLAIAWGSAALVVLPAACVTLASGGSLAGPLTELWPGEASPLAVGAAAAAELALLVLLGNAFGLLGRARSAWLALDLGAGLGALGLADAAHARLRGEYLDELAQRLTLALGLALLAALAIASAAQILAGRCDLRRAHRAFSLALWTLLGLAAGGTELFSRWSVAPTPRDLAAGSLAVDSAPAGDWLFVSGEDRRRGLQPSFLFDAGSGRWQRVGLVFFGGDLALSGDGRHAAWTAILERHLVPRCLDLDASGLAPRDPVLGERLAEAPLALSADGRWLAGLNWARTRVVVFDLATGRPVANAAGPEWSGREALAFARDGHLRLVLWQSAVGEAGGGHGTEVAVYDLAPRGSELALLGRLNVPQPVTWPRLDRDGERMLLQGLAAPLAGDSPSPTPSGSTLLVSLIPGLPASPLAGGASLSWPTFLPDRRLLWVTRDGAARTVHLADPDGHELRRWVFAEAGRLKLGHLNGDALLLSTSDRSRSWSSGLGWRAWRLPLDGGEAESLGEGLCAVGTWFYSPVRSGAPLFLDEQGSLVRLDPANGTRTALLVPR